MYSFSLYVIKKQKKFLKLYAENISPAPKYSHMLYAFMGKYTYKSEHTDYTSFILVCIQMRKYVFAHTHTYPSIFIYTLHVNKKIYLKTAFKIE